MTVNKATIFVLLAAIVLSFPLFADAHRSGCHRWHSCPSDSGSYTCGDTGHPCRYPTYPEGGSSSYSSSTYSYSAPLIYVPSPGFVRITATSTVYALGSSGRPMKNWQDFISFAQNAYGFSSDSNGNPIVKEIDPNAAWGYGINPHFQPPIQLYRIYQVPGDGAIWELSNWHGAWGSRVLFVTPEAFVSHYGPGGWTKVKPITQNELQKYYYLGSYN